MSIAAWSTLLEGLSSYAAIASAYCFVRPALQAEHLRSNIEMLQDAESNATEAVAGMVKTAKGKAQTQLTGSLHRRRRWNRIGFLLLGLSGLLLASAICIHLLNPSVDEYNSTFKPS
ncbi:MAG: hypothetical protein JOZ29_04805 [Deltaproteobacteria bacterium]|nr:hypothetical protein [Deltaproteobacteria bacterium]